MNIAKQRRCVYCGSKDKKFTREHVVSKSVLKVIFGEDIENVALLPKSLGGRHIIDHELQIRDVCLDCNPALSRYDVVGVKLARAIRPHHDATGQSIPFSQDTLGWLIKTHLNEMRATPDETFAQPRAKTAIYRALRNYAQVPLDWYRFYVEGWQGEKSWWTKDSPRSLPWLSYKGVHDADTQVYISNLRMAWLDTFLLLPMDGSYRRFKARCEETRENAAQLGFDWQWVNTTRVTAGQVLPITNVISRIRLERSIYKVSPVQAINRWP